MVKSALMSEEQCALPREHARAIVMRLENRIMPLADSLSWLDKWVTEGRRQLSIQIFGCSDGSEIAYKVDWLVAEGRLGEASDLARSHLSPVYQRARARARRQLQRIYLIEEEIREPRSFDYLRLYELKLLLIAGIHNLSDARSLGSWLYSTYLCSSKDDIFTIESTALLSLAAAANTVALEEVPRDQFPAEWSKTQQVLGKVLVALGKRVRKTEVLQQFALVHRRALEEGRDNVEPRVWAELQNNLANALYALRTLDSGTEHLEEAVALYRDALKLRTYNHDPAAWATTQNDLGDALASLIKRRSETVRLDEAFEAYLSALSWRTRDRAPHLWETTRSSLMNLVCVVDRERKVLRKLVPSTAGGAPNH